MKFAVLILSFIFSLNVFAGFEQLSLFTDTTSSMNNAMDSLDKNSRRYRTNAMEMIKGFDFKEMLNDPKKFEAFISDTVSITEVNSREDFTVLIDRSTKGLFLHQYVTNMPLLSEFFHQLIKTPSAIASFLTIFLKRNALFVFSLLIILSFIISHYLGERKYKYQAMSGKRISYAVFRFSVVNGFRLSAFLFLFAENIIPVTQVYLSSVTEVKHLYPILFKATSLISSVTGYLI